MRDPAFETLEIIRIVEQLPLPAKRMLDKLSIARRTFNRWYDRYLEGGPAALEDRPSAPSRVWSRQQLNQAPASEVKFDEYRCFVGSGGRPQMGFSLFQRGRHCRWIFLPQPG